MQEKMPVLFMGHGSPMNAVEDNPYTAEWKKIAAEIPKPKAVLAVSAHWYTRGTRIADTREPKMVYDMYGFPEELYRVRYPAPGSPELAAEVRRLLGPGVETDNGWGLDHGTWSVLHRMYPDASVPVVQLSVDAEASPERWLQLGTELRPLREQGVLILGSGNVVHNLSRVEWGMRGGFPWAEQFDSYIREKLEHRAIPDVVRYESAGECAKLAFRTPDHFAPLLYVVGASSEEDALEVKNASCTMGALSMTCYLFR